LAHCAYYATKKLPYQATDLLKKIASYFKHSAKRISAFEHVQEILDMKILKILKLAQTRWLSLSACIERLLVLMPALKTYFHNELTTLNNKMRLSTKESELKKTINEIYLLLMHVDTELYFRFLHYVLPLICDLNLEFQSESPRIHKLYSLMDEVCQTLLKNFIKPEVIESGDLQVYKNPANFLRNGDIYAGPWVAAFVEVNSNLTASKLAVFYTNVRNFRNSPIVSHCCFL